jgi:hypothetical protein
VDSDFQTQKFLQTLCHAFQKKIGVILKGYNYGSRPVIRDCEVQRQKVGNSGENGFSGGKNCRMRRDSHSHQAVSFSVDGDRRINNKSAHF